MIDNRELQKWGEGKTLLLSPLLRPQYDKILSTLIPTPILDQQRLDTSVVHYAQDIEGELTIREYTLQRAEQLDFIMATDLPPMPSRQFASSDLALRSMEPTRPHTDSPLCRVVVQKDSAGKGPQTWRVMTAVGLDSYAATRLSWKDGTTFFATSTAHIRRMLNQPRPAPHVALQRWIDEHSWNGDFGRLWRETWHPKSSQDENAFAWQMIYGVPTTLVYRLRWIPINDPSLRCTRCSLLTPETIDHTIFGCPASQQIWEWVNTLLTTLSASTRAASVSLLQVFMADQVNSSIPQLLWRILRKISCFCIWKARNDHFIPLPPIPWN